MNSFTVKQNYLTCNPALNYRRKSSLFHVRDSKLSFFILKTFIHLLIHLFFLLLF